MFLNKKALFLCSLFLFLCCAIAPSLYNSGLHAMKVKVEPSISFKQHNHYVRPPRQTVTYYSQPVYSQPVYSQPVPVYPTPVYPGYYYVPPPAPTPVATTHYYESYSYPQYSFGTDFGLKFKFR